MKKNDNAALQMRKLASESIKDLKQQVMQIQLQSQEILQHSMDEFYKMQFINAEKALAESVKMEQVASETAGNENKMPTRQQNVVQNALQLTQSCIARAMKVTEQCINNAEKIVRKDT